MVSEKIIVLKRRYVVVILIIIFAFLLGQDFGSPPKENIIYINESASDGYVIEPTIVDGRIDDRIATENGSAYRIFWDFVAQKTYDGKVLDDKRDEQVNIDFFLLSRTGDKLPIDTINIRTDQPVYKHETVFTADARYSSLYFHKSNTTFAGSVIIRNIRIYRIDGVSLSSQLKKTIVGKGFQTKVLVDNSSAANNNQNFVKFTKKDQSIGQIIELEEGAISGIDLYIKYVGNGGVGNYNLELKEAIKDDRSYYDIAPESIANIYFDRQKAQIEYEINPNIYHFPLVARGLKGGSYYIGINNKDVKFNIFNTLSVAELTGGDSYGNGSAVRFTKNRKPAIRNSDLFFKIYGVEFAQTSSIKLLSGAIMQDLGGGNGFYSYETSGQPQDFLDIYQATNSESSEPSVYYDSVAGGISARAEKDNNIIYRFETIYPMIAARVNIEPASEEFVEPLIYYSFDNQNWIGIKKNAGASSTMKFDQVFSDIDGKTQFYIRISYNKDDLSIKKIKLFSIRKIKFYANLKY